jgi:ABC-type multidrug transport system fused ATPase/permease subunit
MSTEVAYQAIPTLTRFILKLIKPYKRLLLVMGLIGISWAFINTFLPFSLKLIIDHVVNFSSDKTILFKTTSFYIFIYILLWIALIISMRNLDCVKLKLFPQLREDGMSYMFKYLNQHSHARK